MSRLFTGIAVALALATVIGLVLLWPGDVAAPLAGGLNTTSESAEVLEVEETFCPGFGERRCQLVTMRLTSGPDEGREAEMRLGATGLIDPDVDPGDKIKVTAVARSAARGRAPGRRRVRASPTSSAGLRCSCSL